MKKNYRLLCLITIFSVYSGLFSMEEPQQNWLFIKNMPGAADKEDRDVDWRIKNQKLELNLNATEIMTQQTFADLIAERKKEKLPFLLLMVQSGDKGQFIHFFDGSMIASLLNTQSRTHYSYIQNPLNNQPVTNIEIYVMGDNGKLNLLKGNINEVTDLSFLTTYDIITKTISGKSVPVRDYKLVKTLEIPGIAQAFIARLYREQSDKIIKKDTQEFNLAEMMAKIDRLDQLEKEESNLRMQLAELKQKKKDASLATKSEDLDKEINNIEVKIDEIIAQIKLLKGIDPESEKLFQLERLWLGWSLDKFSPENENQKKLAQYRIEQIDSTNNM